MAQSPPASQGTGAEGHEPIRPVQAGKVRKDERRLTLDLEYATPSAAELQKGLKK